MTTLYFDCFAGASGDMILGALLDAGLDATLLKEDLKKLNLSGFDIDFEKVDRSGISSTKVHVHTAEEHVHRHLSDIVKIIDNSSLSDKVKSLAKAIFSNLAEAEARVHNMPVEKIHFHEVGALDAIVDVVGASIGFDLMDINHFACSEINVGKGTVEMAHGRFPIPAPAVTELLKGAPVYNSDISGELVTPTGAAIITTVCQEFGRLPLMSIERLGYGAGSREYKRFPNVLRIMIGDAVIARLSNSEKLLMLETNVDDMPPHHIGHLMETVFAAGALDCFFTPTQMKKNRPGVQISVLCQPTKADELCDLLFSGTTTLGVRFLELERRSLEREFTAVQTPYGQISIKVSRSVGDHSSIVKAMPEYEDCRRAAMMNNVSVQVIEEAARTAFAALKQED
ncbi:MAG: nickel pincer cofactor biosynthesis protein LarC [Pyrinomonadaceae bacterium]